MKRTSAFLLFAMLISAAVVRAGDVKVKATITTKGEDAPGSVFLANIPKVVVSFETTGAKSGDKIRGAWVADDVGDAAPANTKIDEATVTMSPVVHGGTFSVTKPTKGWPPGQYHLDIYANDELATTVKFRIEAMEKAEKREAAEKEEHTAKKTKAKPEGSANSSDDEQYSFKVHNGNSQRITKLLVSEDGQDYGKFDIGDGIEPGETTTLNWDKSTNKSDCNWYIKAVYVDKSVGEAVKFNFCEEDLVIDF
jgi:hypothetical protein